MSAIIYSIGLSVAYFLLIGNFFTPRTIFNIKTILSLFKESWSLSASNLLTQGYMYINVFLLKAFSTPSQISFFQIPQRIIEPLKMLPRSVMMAVAPTFSILAHTKEKKEELLFIYYIIGYSNI